MFYNLIFLVYTVSAFPSNWIQRIAENNHFDEFENYLPKFGDLPKFEYSTNNKLKTQDVSFKNDVENSIDDDRDSLNNRKAKTLGDVLDFIKEGTEAGMEIVNDVTNIFSPTNKPDDDITTTFPDTTIASELTTATTLSPTEATTDTQLYAMLENNTISSSLDPISDGDSNNLNETSRIPRQEDVVTNNTIETTSTEKESQEEENSDEDGEGGNMITGILSALLGGLSRPDGSIDLEAITGLLGSLSTQNPDGSYDFSGLTELLMNFFGADENGGGGSDFGAFTGGLLGALLKGVANPPGAKGAGIFTGKLVAGVLPALSGPAPTADGTMPNTPKPQLDSGNFLGGFLSTILGSSSGGGNAPGGGGSGGGSKFSIIKMIFSMITSIFGASSKSN